ncbi:MAG: 7-carboxy-7-deazaguanine synthase QueE [Cyanobium sp.]
MTEPATVPRPTELTLPVVETFHSLQGEGMHAGRSAFFIRLAGCAVGCPWCDTKHSWPTEVHPHRSLAELAGEARSAAAAGAAFAVITGGEPLEHDLGPLCAALLPEVTGLPLHLETSGAAPLALSGHFAWITLSPKRHRPPSPELLAACDELKVVVHEPADLAFAEEMAAGAIACAPTSGTGTAPALLLQPGWESAEGQELALNFVRSHPAWRLSLQSHKWLGVR